MADEYNLSDNDDIFDDEVADDEPIQEQRTAEDAGSKSSTSNKNEHLDSSDSEKATQSSSQAQQSAKEQNQDLKDVSAGKVLGGRGGSKPWIFINDFPIDDKMLESVEIDLTDFYPTIFLEFSLKSGKFTTRQIPRDGDVVSVFIRSHTDILIPIEVHFLITKVETSKSKDPEGNEMTYYINGILNVPLLYAEDCFSIPNTTSIKALSAIAAKLKLGFATNEKETKDEQTWICAWETYKDFIKNITEHAWSGDNAFYDSWIDWYYKLNFSNMNKQMSAPDSSPAHLGLALYTKDDYDYKYTSDIIGQDIKHVLTNDPSAKDSNYYFSSIEILSNAGEINITNGYKRYVHFYEYAFRKAYQDSSDPINDNIEDKVADMHSIIWVDPITTEGAEKSKRLQKGRPGEKFFENTIKRKWQGLQYFDPDKEYRNVHPYYRLAQFQNFQNNSDIKKLMVVCHLPECNFNFYRGQVVKVFYSITNDNERGKSSGNIDDKQTKTGRGIDRTLSGIYTIYGIKIIYQKDPKKKGNNRVNKPEGNFSQQLILGRREWPVSNAPDNADIAKASSDRLFNE